MHIPVHSVAGYIDVMETSLVILTMAGLFPDGPLYIHHYSIMQNIFIAVHILCALPIYLPPTPALATTDLFISI